MLQRMLYREAIKCGCLWGIQKKLLVKSDNIEVVEGQIQDIENIRVLLTGCEIVIENRYELTACLI